MHIDIRGHLKPTDAIRDHVERRLAFALGRYEPRIRAITVRLDDVNGPQKGGSDKACRVTIAMASGRDQPVLVEEVQADMYVAISRAAERSARAVGREIERSRYGRARSAATAS